MDKTVKERAAELGLTTYDTALPQDWFDDVIRMCDHNPGDHIVWSYDDSLMGEPVALTLCGESIVGMMRGGISRPFGDQHRPSGEMYDTLWFAVNAIREAKEEN